MTSNLELYGRKDVPNVPAHVTDLRIGLLKERLKELTSVYWMEQNNNLIDKVCRAIEFWTKLRDGETI